MRVLEYKIPGLAKNLSASHIFTHWGTRKSKQKTTAKHGPRGAVYFSEEGIPVNTGSPRKKASPSFGRDDFFRTDSKK